MEKSVLHNIREYELEGLALLLYWSMPYDYKGFKAYEQGVSEYNITLPGDQYKINQELEISAIWISNATSLENDTTGVYITTDVDRYIKSNEVATKPVFAKKFITDSKVYLSIEPGIGIIAVEGDNPAKLDGEIIHVYGAERAALYLFSKNGFVLNGASFNGFSKVSLIADSIHNYFSDDQLNGLSESAIQSKKYNNKLNSIVVENGIKASDVELTLFASNFDCSGSIEIDKLAVNLNPPDDVANIASGCKVQANDLIYTIGNSNATFEVTAPITAKNITMINEGSFASAESVQANTFQSKSLDFTVREKGAVITSNFHTQDGLLESGSQTIEATGNVSIDKGGELYGGKELSIKAKEVSIEGKIASISETNIEAEAIGIAEASIESNGAINLKYKALKMSSSNITAWSGVTIQSELSSTCLTSIGQNNIIKCQNGKITVHSIECPLRINDSSLIAQSNIEITGLTNIGDSQLAERFTLASAGGSISITSPNIITLNNGSLSAKKGNITVHLDCDSVNYNTSLFKIEGMTWETNELSLLSDCSDVLYKQFEQEASKSFKVKSLKFEVNPHDKVAKHIGGFDIPYSFEYNVKGVSVIINKDLITTSGLKIISTHDAIIEASMSSKDEFIIFGGAAIKFLQGNTHIYGNATLAVFNQDGTILFDEGATFYSKGLTVFANNGKDIETLRFEESGKLGNLDIASSKVEIDGEFYLNGKKLNIFAKDMKTIKQEPDYGFLKLPPRIQKLSKPYSRTASASTKIFSTPEKAWIHAFYYTEEFSSKPSGHLSIKGNVTGNINEVNLFYGELAVGNVFTFTGDEQAVVKVRPYVLNKIMQTDPVCYCCHWRQCEDWYFRSLVDQALRFHGMDPARHGDLKSPREYIEPYKYIKSTWAVPTVKGNVKIENNHIDYNTNYNLAISPPDLNAKFKQITAGKMTADLIISSNQIATQLNSLNAVKLLDPNRVITFADRNKVSTDGKDLSSYHRNYVVSSYPAIASPSAIENLFDELFRQKFRSFYECDIKVEELITQLGFLPTQFGKIICGDSCNLDLLKEAIFDATGFRALKDMDEQLKEYLKNYDTKEEQCAELHLLMRASVEAYKKHKVVIGSEWPEHLANQVATPFFALVYRNIPVDSNGNYAQALVPAIYFPEIVIQQAGGFRYGATVKIDKIEEGSKVSIINSGGILLGEGTLEGEQVINTGTIHKTGKGNLLIKTKDFASASMIAHKLSSNSITGERQTYAQIIADDGQMCIEADRVEIFGTRLVGNAHTGGLVGLKAKEYFVVAPSQQINARYSSGSNGYSIDASLKNILSSAEGNVYFESGSDIQLIGVDGLKADMVKVTSGKGKVLYGIAVDKEMMETLTIEEDEGVFYDETTKSYQLSYTEEIKGNQWGTAQLPMKSFMSYSYNSTTGVGFVIYTYEFKMEAVGDEAKVILLPGIAANYVEQYTQVTKEGLIAGGGKLSFSKVTETKDIYKVTISRRSEVNYLGNEEALISGTAGVEIISSVLDAPYGGNITLSSAKGNVTVGSLISESTEHSHNERVQETGLGFKIGFREISVGVNHKIQKEDVVTEHAVPIKAGITANIINIMAQEGSFNTVGAKVIYRDLNVDAKKMVDAPAQEIFKESKNRLSGEISSRVGIFFNAANAIDATKAIRETEGHDVNKVFALGNALISWLGVLGGNIASLDLKFSASVQNDKLNVHEIKAEASEYISTGTTRVNVDTFIMTGSQLSGVSWYVKCIDALMEGGFNSFEVKRKSDGGRGDVSVLDLKQITAGMSAGYFKEEEKTANNLRAKLSGIFSVEASGEARFENVVIKADDIRLKVKQLVIKAIQNIIKREGRNGNFAAGIPILQGDYKPFLDGIGAEYERRDAAWVGELTSIIGEKRVEVVVEEMFRIAGAMVAQAKVDENGKYIDGGNLHLKAYEILAENIISYDKGKIVGAGFSFVNKKLDGMLGNRYSFTYGDIDYEKTTYSTIGDGNKEIVNGIKGAINNDITKPESEVEGGKTDTIRGFYQYVDFNKAWSTVKNAFTDPKSVADRAVNNIKDNLDTLGDIWNKITGNEPEPLEIWDVLDLKEEAEADQEIEEMIDELDILESEEEEVEGLDDESELRLATKHSLEVIDEEVMRLASDIIGGEGKEAVRLALVASVAKLLKSGMSVEEATEIALPKIIEAKKEYDKIPKIHKAALQLALKGVKAGLKEVIRNCMANAACISEAVGISKIASIMDAIDITQEEQEENIRKFFKDNANEQSESEKQDVEKGIGGSGSGNDYDPEEEVRKLRKSKLEDHEGGGHKGHTIENHAGKDKEFLMSRLNKEERLKDASSFKDRDTAENCVKKIFDKRMKKIIKWFKNAAIGKDKAFSTDFDEVIGYGLKRGENVLTPKNKAMVLLKKTKDGIKIVTSHPID